MSLNREKKPQDKPVIAKFGDGVVVGTRDAIYTNSSLLLKRVTPWSHIDSVIQKNQEEVKKNDR